MSDFIASQDPGQHPCGSQPDADTSATAGLALRADIDTILKASFPGWGASRPMAVECIMRLIRLHGRAALATTPEAQP